MADELIAGGTDCLVAGDMGIGNTTPSAVAHRRARRIAGRRGDRAPAPGSPPTSSPTRRRSSPPPWSGTAAIDDPLVLLAEVGGLEIAAMAGLYLGAAAAGVPFIVDGVIAAAGRVRGRRARARHGGPRHRRPPAPPSRRPSSRSKHLGLDPLLDLELRLGEGTGACLAIPLVQAAARALRDMADLPAA